MKLFAQAAAFLPCLLCPRAGLRRALQLLVGTPLVLGALVVGPAGPAPAAAEGGLEIELNKVEDSGGGCLASFVVYNGLGHTLDRFSMDLYVFDRAGIIAREVLIDLAPLRTDKTRVARFALIQRACEEVGRVLVNDIPSCRSQGTGEILDCLDGLAVSSRSRVEMVK